jgi:hypothetical protein
LVGEGEAAFSDGVAGAVDDDVAWITTSLGAETACRFGSAFGIGCGFSWGWGFGCGWGAEAGASIQRTLTACGATKEGTGGEPRPINGNSARCINATTSTTALECGHRNAGGGWAAMIMDDATIPFSNRTHPTIRKIGGRMRL